MNISFFNSLAIMLIGGAVISFVFKKIKLPQLVGYLFFGIAIGYFNLINTNILNISASLRKIALVIILVKAGLGLDINKLKSVGKSAILMSFVPACFEMVLIGFLAHLIFGLNYVESFLLGSVVGAVSPAVVVPFMNKMMDEKIGSEKGIPELITAAASIDDIIMIVFYTVFLNMRLTGSISFVTFLNIPISILSGVVIGIVIGLILSFIFRRNDKVINNLIIMFGTAFLLVYLEEALDGIVSYSSLLSIITLAIVIRLKDLNTAKDLMSKCNDMWVLAEIILFELVGASLKIEYLSLYFLPSLLLILGSLIFRSLGVNLSLLKTKFNVKERIFITISYMPKATVQAAIGGGLLDLGISLSNSGMIEAGTIVLAVSVTVIMLTAPTFAILMDKTYKKLVK